MDIGSRCETDANNGISHFLEHMYLKGTKNRTHKVIQEETIQKGATWHVCTSREMLAIYANCHHDDVEWGKTVGAWYVLISVVQPSVCWERLCPALNMRTK